MGEDRLGSSQGTHKARARRCTAGVAVGFIKVIVVSIWTFFRWSSTHLQDAGARPTSATRRGIFVSGLRYVQPSRGCPRAPASYRMKARSYLMLYLMLVFAIAIAAIAAPFLTSASIP